MNKPNKSPNHVSSQGNNSPVKKTPTHKKRIVTKGRSYTPMHPAKTSQKKQGHKPKPGGNKNNRNKNNKNTRRPKKNLSHFDKAKNFNRSKKESVIPPVGENIRIIPLGGVEEIGKNMTVIEYGQDIIVIDAGFQFRGEETPGIDYILPNTKYLEARKDRVRAVIITHGHLDHIGAVPYIMNKIGNPPIYSRKLTTIMLKKRQEEFPNLPPLDIQVVESTDRIKMGNLYVKFFAVTHTIPDSMGIVIETPYGNIVHTGDLKLDHDDGIPTEEEEESFAILENENNLLLMADSTNVEQPGFSTPEKKVHKNIEKIIAATKGRMIVGTFASLLERIIKIIEIAESLNKKVVIDGRSMKNNVEIAKEVGILKTRKGTIISADEMDNYPPDRILALATGAQGDEFASLMRMAQKKHAKFKINKRDTVMLSSSVVPGNEKSVQKLKDNLSRQGAHIIHYRTSEVHSSGHAYREETAWIHKKIGAKFFMPVHGYHYMLTVHRDIAKSIGVPEKNIIVPDNGMVIEIQDKGQKIVSLKENAPRGVVMVDGFSIGDMQEVVIRDRKLLAQDGMFVVIATLNLSTGKLKKSPDIISRGFVYLRESQDLLDQTRLIVKKTVEDSASGMKPVNFDYIKDHVTDNVARFLYQKTAKRPIVIPVILGI